MISVLTAQAGVLTDYRVYQTPYISIISPTPDEYVSTGNLTISGTSSDNATSDCTVYVSWNGSSPYQTANANGTGGLTDYSTWNYTYTPTYHEIVNGTNQLDSLLYCSEVGPDNSLNSFVQPINVTHSINVTGINSNLSNFTGTEYYYQDNSSAGYFDPGTTLTSGDGLDYDSSGITYSTDDTGLDTSSNDYDFDDYFNDDSDGSSSNNNDDDDDNDDTNDETNSGETDSGTPVAPSPVPEDGVFDIGAAGDWGSESGAGKTALNMHQQGVDLAIGLGDYSYEEGAENVKKWWNSQMAPLHGLFKGALGNHDTKDQATYAQLFGLSGEWHYSFNKNGVHFVAINTEGDYGPGSSQYKFIDKDLQAASTSNDVNWIVVFLHQPMYTSPSHHDPLTSLRDAYHPLFDKYGVDLVLQGHNHNYQRSYPIMYNSEDPAKPITFPENDKGVFTDPPGQIYAEIGTAGKSKYSLEGKSSFIAEQFDTDVGFLNIEFPNDKTMNAIFYDNNGGIKDKFAIDKSGSNKPVGVNDIAITEEDTPVTIEVLTNDKNQYGLAATPNLPNPNLQVQVAVVGSGPLHGIVKTGNNGSNNENVLTYTPTQDYFGSDSFTYRISPATGIGSTSSPTKVTVSVDPVNDPPVANNDNATYDQGSSGGTLNVIANDVDPDGDSLKVTEVSDTSETPTSNQSKIVNNLDGTISYIPASDFIGVDSFSYVVSDGTNATASATVRVTVLPTNSPIPPLGPNTNATNGNVTNTNVTSITNSNFTSANATIPISNSTYFPLVQQNNSNNNETLDQPDMGVASNSSLQTKNQNLIRVNVTNNNNNYESSSNNTRSVSDANIILNAAIENLKNNRPSESQFQNQTATNLEEINGDNISSRKGVIGKLDGLYDRTIANEMARAAAQDAEQAMRNRNNDAIADSSVTERDSNSQNATTNDQILLTSDNIAEESKLPTLDDAKETGDSSIQHDMSYVQTRQELERQVQSELARAQESMHDKVGDSITETQHSSNTASDDSEISKESVNTDESITPSSNIKQEENQGSKKQFSSATSENSRSQQDKNSKPNADAGGHSQGVREEGNKVILDGSNSNDKDGDKLSYSWKQVQGPRVKISHDNDAVATFEAPAVPQGKDQMKLQFVLVVSDDKSTDKDTISVSIRQDPSQENEIDDEKTRKSVDDHKSKSNNAKQDRNEDSSDSSTKSDDNNDENDNDKNAKQDDDSKKSNETSRSQGDNMDAPKEDSNKPNDKEEDREAEENSDEGKSDSNSDSS